MVFQLYVCAVVVFETMFIHNAVAYAGRWRSAPDPEMMGLLSTPRLTPMLHRSGTDVSLLPESLPHLRYPKDPKLFALKVRLAVGKFHTVHLCTIFMRYSFCQCPLHKDIFIVTKPLLA